MERKVVTFEDGTEATIINDDGRVYVLNNDNPFNGKKTNKKVIKLFDGKPKFYMQNVVIPEDKKEEKPVTEQEFVQVHEKKKKSTKKVKEEV